MEKKCSNFEKVEILEKNVQILTKKVKNKLSVLQYVYINIFFLKKNVKNFNPKKTNKSCLLKKNVAPGDFRAKNAALLILYKKTQSF